MGNIEGLSELLFSPKTRDLLDGTVMYTGRLLRMLPLVFQELYRAVFRLSRVVVGLFAHIASSEDIMIFHQKSSKIDYFWPRI